jgi:hypothetical protein
LNRRELHTCFLNTKTEISASKTSVTSLDKRDRQSLFQRTSISADPANSAAHVSLSSHIQLSNNRPDKPSRIPIRQPKAIASNPISIAANPETQSRKSPSPAAPPPSFCDAAYTAIPFSKSTAPFQKNQLSRNALI